MDVKFPADHYLASLQAPTEAEQSDHERAFLRAVRGHLKAVAGRGYTDPSTTPGIALIFIPNEAIYSFVMSADPDLVDVALAQRLVVCSPFTLFAVLAVIRQSTEAFRIGQASDELREGLTRFRAEWERFAGQLDRVAKQWETAHRGFEELAGTRRRQLERHLDRVDLLGVDARGSDLLSLVAPASSSRPETQISDVGGAR
jgi:DNA recombination protein RmuC